MFSSCLPTHFKYSATCTLIARLDFFLEMLFYCCSFTVESVIQLYEGEAELGQSKWYPVHKLDL